MEHRGVLILSEPDRGKWHPHVVAVALAAMTRDRSIDVHGPDAWDVDGSLAIIGLVVRREDHYETSGFRAGSRHIVRYFGTR